jgi:2-dehydropantoate 2-reductase
MKIIVFGAGSIGTYVGGALHAAGGNVELIGRARLRERLAQGGLRLSDLQGRDMRVEGVAVTDDPAALGDADLVLVTVKSADTATAAEAIRAHAKPSAIVLSLQNGVGNVDVLRERLKQSDGWTVLGGMVPFNVVQLPDNRFHRGTAGEIMVEASPALSPWKALFQAAHLPLVERSDFLAVQWGKLLLNLNNPINALSGIPLKAELSQRGYRRCLALLIDEALEALKAAGIEPAQVATVAPRKLPFLMRLPDFLFHRVAAKTLRIDPQARSSMWEDLQAGRKTEVDYLNGAVVSLAHAHGRKAEANQRVVDLIHAVEKGQPAGFSADELFRLLKAPATAGTARAAR